MRQPMILVTLGLNYVPVSCQYPDLPVNSAGGGSVLQLCELAAEVAREK